MFFLHSINRFESFVTLNFHFANEMFSDEFSISNDDSVAADKLECPINLSVIVFTRQTHFYGLIGFVPEENKNAPNSEESSEFNRVNTVHNKHL